MIYASVKGKKKKLFEKGSLILSMTLTISKMIIVYLIMLSIGDMKKVLQYAFQIKEIRL